LEYSSKNTRRLQTKCKTRHKNIMSPCALDAEEALAVRRTEANAEVRSEQGKAP